MIVKINGGPVDWFTEQLNSLADSIIQTEADFIFKPFFNAIERAVISLGHLINQNSAEIITLAVCGCGFVIMIAPLLGQSQSKWLGRLFGVIFLGVTWRLLI